jgi:respiratory nitrate reductase gamma subunit
MSSMNYLIWGVFPYVALTLFFVVPFLRMIYRPFGLTTRASGIFMGRDVLGLAAHLLHWGIFLVFFGHLAGLVGGILGWGSWVGAFFWMGTLGGLAAVTGSIIALVRRFVVPEMRAMSQIDDYVVHLFLIAILGAAIHQAVVSKIWGAAYTAGPWFASLWRFSPQPELMASAPIGTKIHVFLAFAFAAYFPFTKLIHAWTLPINYLVRPYQVMRTTARKFQDKWDFGLAQRVRDRWQLTLVSDKSYMTYVSIAVISLLLGIAFVLPSPSLKAFVQEAYARSTPSAQEQPAGQGARKVLEGYPLYVNQCARCHGLSGEGDGPGAQSPTFATVPRNLTTGYFRYLSTANGVASDADLRRVLLNGLHGSGMPAFDALNERQIASLVSVLNVLWKGRPAAGNGIAVPPRPEMSDALVAAGKEVYEGACTSCHGPKGRGDGPIADSIKDSYGHPIRPRNFTAGTLKGGPSATQVYYRIAAGIPAGDGNWLMPPQNGNLSPDKIWAVIAYLESEVLPGGSLAEASAE